MLIVFSQSRIHLFHSIFLQLLCALQSSVVQRKTGNQDLLFFYGARMHYAIYMNFILVTGRRFKNYQWIQQCPTRLVDRIEWIAHK